MATTRNRALSKIKIAIVDDHTLFRKGIIQLITLADSKQYYHISFEACDGIEMIKKIKVETLPDVILVDINMPNMNGFDTVKWLKQHYPSIRILVLSMSASQESIINILRLGANGYLSKNIEPEELHRALISVHEKGVYITDTLSGMLFNSLSTESTNASLNGAKLNEKEKVFLKWACTELSYKEIAEQMFISPKTVDGYRQNLFEKFGVNTRVGLAMYAVKHGLLTT